MERKFSFIPGRDEENFLFVKKMIIRQKRLNYVVWVVKYCAENIWLLF